jgi:hypothetical protein
MGNVGRNLKPSILVIASLAVSGLPAISSGTRRQGWIAKE